MPLMLSIKSARKVIFNTLLIRRNTGILFVSNVTLLVEKKVYTNTGKIQQKKTYARTQVKSGQAKFTVSFLTVTKHSFTNSLQVIFKYHDNIICKKNAAPKVGRELPALLKGPIGKSSFQGALQIPLPCSGHGCKVKDIPM